MNSLSLLIKPSSGDCNVRCRYCFYHDEQCNRETFSYGFMSEETLEILIQKALESAKGECSFGFQGGEPTLSGLPFFRKAVELQKKYNVHHTRISNAIQTNGLLIDDEWAEFLAENHFLVGLSLDGTKDIHDANRIDPAGKGTYAKVLRAAQILKNHGVYFNILTVITGKTADSITKIYNFYRRSGFLYQQYIPCLDPMGEGHGNSPYALTPEQYGSFLIRLFRLWYRDLQNGCQPFIRTFENYVALAAGYQAEVCEQRGLCGIQYVVEADGSVYPCDFYMLDEYRLGNFNQDFLETIDKKREEIGFISRSRNISEDCMSCPHYKLCRGGCQRNRDPEPESGRYRNYLCQGYRRFFDVCGGAIRAIASELNALR